ncbi:MAG: transcriptional regulator [Candidatus Aenigmatarchaeota archaeon]
MILPCDFMTKYFASAVKAKIVKSLYQKGMKQKEIAKITNLTQAMVSKYISEKYDEKVKELENTEMVEKIVRIAIKKIQKGEDFVIPFNKKICKYCGKYES